jgi:ssDNA-binding Zn-finger/Zn-ribbon topoisomerase 1
MHSQTKFCKKCEQILPHEAFSKCSGGNYLRPECKSCGNKLAKKRKELRSKFGNPPSNYTCPICGKNESQIPTGGGRKSTKWVIDHNHENDLFRGWLCHTCNMGIGSFDDSIATLWRAIIYLTKTKIFKGRSYD